MVNRKYTATERMDSLVVSLPTKGALRWSGHVLRQLDLEHADQWMAQLRDAESEIRQLRAQIEGVVSGRTCGYCGNKVGGRSDRKYCSDACRQMGHRARLSQLES